MLTKEEFLKPPPCKKCNGVVCNETGWYGKRILTDKDAEEYETALGEEVRIRCSYKKLLEARKSAWLTNPYFEDDLKFYQLGDFEPDRIKSQAEQLKTRGSLDFIKELLEEIQKGNNPQGFLEINGQSLSGKSTLAAIIGRESTLAGLYPKQVSLLDLVEELSHLREGTKATDSEGNELYNLDNWANADILVVDHLDMVNDYFRFADLKRANLNLLFQRRLKSKKLTILLTCMRLEDVFDPDVRAAHGIPNDLPKFINKDYTRLEIYGRFEGKQVKKADLKEERKSDEDGTKTRTRNKK